MKGSPPQPSRLATLQRNRDRLTELLEEAAPYTAAALAKELRATWVEIDELAKAETKGSPLDELRNRREGRGADSDAAPLAGRRRRRAGGA